MILFRPFVTNPDPGLDAAAIWCMMGVTTTTDRKAITMKNFLIGAALSGATLIGMQSCEPSTIGDTEVPAGLHCEEDELIGYNPDTPANAIECVHPDVFVTRYAEQQVND